MFEDHLAWLAGECRCIRFADIPTYMKGAPPDRPVVAITFDDGYADNHEYALPLLEKHGLPGTFFLTVGLVENDRRVVERFETLLSTRHEDFRPMSWTQVKELRDAGMELGAHTYSHPNLARCSAAAAREELSRSKELIEQEVGQVVASTAYPFGKPKRHITDETLKIAAQVGYKQGAAILHRGVHSSDSRMSIPRFNIVRDNPKDLGARVWGRLDLVGLSQRWAPSWIARVLTPEDFRFQA
jgi:peptidoglycan/xylan/chitin deacetylase (PgdA/CDA1 family)